LKIPKNIIISRSDSIGDVVLTLPVAAVLKKNFPQIKIGFLGRAYTRPVIEACKYVDQFIDTDDFLKKKITIDGKNPQAILHVFPVPAIAWRSRKLKIPLRIGTTNRLYHWFTCNKLVRLSRKNSDLHEAQLNIQLLRPFGIPTDFPPDEIGTLFGMELFEPLQPSAFSLIKRGTYHLILHPKSQGSAREWPLEHYIQLIRSLDAHRYTIFISGTQKEQSALQPLLDQVGHLVTDITGKLTLPQFISFIKECDGLVACSTGPLHLAAALGKDAIGIYPPIRPVHPGRWRPLGPGAHVFVLDKTCTECKGNQLPCRCMNSIKPVQIKEYLDKLSGSE
jgi:ADP-heptose:LPS heptosyltransferase